MQTKYSRKGKLVLAGSKPVELRRKSITVKINFFGERFLYDSPLLVVKHFPVWPAVATIFRFRCNTKGALKWNPELCEDFTQFHQQFFKADNSIDDDFAA